MSTRSSCLLDGRRADARRRPRGIAGVAVWACVALTAAFRGPGTPDTTQAAKSPLAAGTGHSCGIAASGAAFCWGLNESGQLGDGITTAGAAYCWGWNLSGRLGDGTVPGEDQPAHRSSPVAVAGGLAFVTIAAGLNHICGLATGGAAHCWGGNGSGRLGDGTDLYGHRSSPVAVSGNVSFRTIEAGGAHACGVATGGAAYCWGAGMYGQLGNGARGYRNPSPVVVTGGLTYGATGTDTPAPVR